jgi:MFS family permease
MKLKEKWKESTERKNIYKLIFLLSLGNIGFSVFSAFRNFNLIFFINKFTNSKTQIGFLMSIISFAGMIVPPLIGMLTDRLIGIIKYRKYVLIFGLLLFILSLTFLEGTKNLKSLYINLTLVSIFFFASLIPFQSLVPNIIPKNYFAKTNGILNFMSYIAQGIFIVLILFLHSDTARFLLIYLGIFISIFSILFIPENKEEFKENERNSIDFNYFKGRLWVKLFALQWFIWYGISSIGSFILLFFQDALSASLKDYIIALGIFGIISWIVSIPIGFIADKYSKEKLTAIGLGLLAGSGILFSQTYRLIHTYPPLILYGISLSLLTIVPYSLLLSYIPKEKAGGFVGINNLIVSSSQTLSYFLSGLVIDYGSYRVNFLQATLASMIALLILRRIDNSS